MDEQIAQKVADVTMEKYQTAGWEKYNIYFKKEEEIVPKLVLDTMTRHKREFILKIIRDIKTNLPTSETPSEDYMKIVKLTQIKNKIDEEMHRVV